MAVPKKRISKYRRSIRRSHHALKVVNAIICKTCGDLHR